MREGQYYYMILCIVKHGIPCERGSVLLYDTMYCNVSLVAVFYGVCWGGVSVWESLYHLDSVI